MDKNNGLCSKCEDGFKLIYGQCLKIKKCEKNQYLNNNGFCIDVTPGC